MNVEDPVRSGLEAAAKLREKAASSPRHRPKLALELVGLSLALLEKERPAEAVPVAQEVVTLLRELAQAKPARYGLDLVGALNVLGIAHTNAGHPAEAVPIAQEAVSRARESAHAKPARHRSDLACVLTNLGIALAQVAPAEAVPAQREVVAIRRELAGGRPSRRQLLELSESMNDLAGTFAKLGQAADVLEVRQELVEVWRKRARVGPAFRADPGFRFGLAMALYNLGLALAEVGRPADALTAEQEAEPILRALAEDDPAGFLADHAVVCATLGARQTQLGHATSGLPFAQEAVGHFRRLFETDPGYRPHLADALSVLGEALEGAGRRQDAQSAKNEAGRYADEP
ncbi:tetratricopeptide repeat protein [Spirillospora sp. NPDC047279]|uniref:tetratricopeptide repeat protein n=1 Tax=Spirillospora sp. NPDC047279 TaxID=3155478 RepID=UPI003410FAB7